MYSRLFGILLNDNGIEFSTLYENEVNEKEGYLTKSDVLPS